MRQIARRVRRAQPRSPSGDGMRRTVTVLVAMTMVALLVGACEGSSGSGPGTGDKAGSSSTLTIGHTIPPNSMDPAKINTSSDWYTTLAYDPLIYMAPDGTLEPRLAESWRYVGKDYKTFELKLRSKVTFSDGASLTAAGVKAHIEYFQKAGGIGASLVKDIAAVDAVDALTVRIRLSAPHPQMPVLFTQGFLVGNVISPKALDSPATLATQTFGAGQYTLVPSETVANDRYTYTPNPDYWNPDDIHYEKVVIKVLPNPNTALAALKTKQVDVILGDYTTAGEAESAAFQVKHVPVNFVGLNLADRAGKMVPALGDLRVRRALNYAVDWKKITTGLYGTYGTPTEQVRAPGQDGYNDTNYYTYDPNKAKRLLADAGYPNGFTLPVLASTYSGSHLVVQAIADDLKKIGVQLKLTVESDVSKYLEGLANGSAPAYGILFGTGQPVHLMGPILFLPEAASGNPHRSADAELTALYQKAATADEATRATLDRQIVRRLVEQGWFVPVVFSPKFYYARPDTVSGLEVSAKNPRAYPYDWHPAS